MFHNISNLFIPSMEEGPKCRAKMDGRHGRIGPLDPPQFATTNFLTRSKLLVRVGQSSDNRLLMDVFSE